MCILASENTRTIVQNITGNVGRTQVKLMLEYGTRIVAGVTPGKGGTAISGIPVYDTVKAALREHPAEASISFVPPQFAKDAAVEAIDANVKLLVIITEHIPVHDIMFMRDYANSAGVTMIGPTTPGLISPRKTKIGIMPAKVFSEGKVGIVSRSGTLLYEIAGDLSMAKIGQSTCLGIGGDPVVGTDISKILELFEEDEQTDLVVIVGEIGGVQEEEAAEFIKNRMRKPVVAYIAGLTAPSGEKMGHAGAIIQGERGTAESKIRALKKAEVKLADRPCEVALLVRNLLGGT